VEDRPEEESLSESSDRHEEEIKKPLAAPDSDRELRITVGEYMARGEGRTQYTVYNLHVQTLLEQYTSKSFEIERRFNDFSWLRERLADTYKGCIVPPIPDKTLIQNRFDTEFIERRRNELFKFLDRIARHPILARSKIVQQFLESKQLADIQTAKPQKKVTTRMFSFLSQTVTQTISPAEEIDPTFDKRKELLTVAETQLKNLLRVLLLLDDNQRVVAERYYAFGVSSSELGSCEHQADEALAKDWIKLGSASDKIRLRVLDSVAVGGDRGRLAESLSEWIRLIECAREALSNRSEKLAHWQSMKKQTETRKAKRDKLTGVNKTKAEKEVQEFETKTSEAKAEYEEITDMLTKELERFDKEKETEIQKAFKEYVLSNRKSSQAIATQWKQIIDHLQTETL